MSKFEYKVIQQQEDETDVDFLERINNWGMSGWRYMSETNFDGGLGRVILEKSYESRGTNT